MNKKLAIVAALIFGAAGLFLANTVKAQDATDNSAMNSDSGAAMNSDAAAPAAPAAQ
jgi:hypothetical protein